MGDSDVGVDRDDPGEHGRWAAWRRADLATVYFCVLIAAGLVVRVLLAPNFDKVFCR